MNDDLISRAEAIKAVEKSRQLNHHTDKKAISAHEHEHRHFMRILTELPSAQPEQRWIPCSERLPDLNKYSHGKIWKQKVLITGYLSFDDKKELFISEAFASDVINGRVHDTVIIAWMPLPEPWKGDTRE